MNDSFKPVFKYSNWHIDTGLCDLDVGITWISLLYEYYIRNNSHDVKAEKIPKDHMWRIEIVKGYIYFWFSI